MTTGTASPSSPTQPGALERLILDTLCEPVLRRIPARVHPNHISIATHLIVWLTAVCAGLSRELAHPYRSLALFAAGLGMLLQMVGDCLDGMHARRTGQCSKMGEMMDHWLDASAVPLSTVGITLALDLSPLQLVLVNSTAIMVYHAQLLLYHHTGRFVHPDATSGVEGQFGVVIAYLALGSLLLAIPPQTTWLAPVVTLAALLATAVQLRCCWFYYRQLTGRLQAHVHFVSLLGASSVLFLMDWLSLGGFVALLVGISFRICGSYVLHTVVKKTYAGHDWGIVLFLLASACTATFYGEPNKLQAALPYAAAGYMFVRNLLDFVRDYAALRPGTTHE